MSKAIIVFLYPIVFLSSCEEEVFTVKLDYFSPQELSGGKNYANNLHMGMSGGEFSVNTDFTLTEIKVYSNDNNYPPGACNSFNTILTSQNREYSEDDTCYFFGYGPGYYAVVDSSLWEELFNIGSFTYTLEILVETQEDEDVAGTLFTKQLQFQLTI